jgi:hypothetical protein
MDNAIQRLGNVMHFVINFTNLNKLELNTTLLLKIIFFAEVQALYDGVPSLTNANMVKAQYGPVPDRYSEALNKLANENKIKISKLNYSTFCESLSPPDSSLLNEQQINILQSITTSICNKFIAGIISEWTHKNRIWEQLDNDEKVPLAAYLPNSKVFEKLTHQEVIDLNKRWDSLEIPN